MASPQKEKGYTAIANEIMEALGRIRIPGQARQVLDVILRKTYGFNKKEDAISLSQFVNATGFKKATILKAINKLISMSLITKKGNSYIKKYRFNKDFETWEPLPKKITLPKKVMVLPKKGSGTLPKKGPTKVDRTKVDYTKEKKRFIKPTTKELKNYFITKKNDNEDGAEFKAICFVEFYESKGWMIGKNKMVSWPHAASRAYREWDWDSKRKKNKPAAGCDIISTEKIMNEREALDDRIEQQKDLIKSMDTDDPDLDLENKNLADMESQARLI